MVLYEIAHNAWNSIIFIPVEPTGRWMIKTGPTYDEPTLFIEIYNRFLFIKFREWVCENVLEVAEAETAVVFECEK